MTLIDEAQDYLIEIVGTGIFLIGAIAVLNSAYEFVPSISSNFFLGVAIIIVGLILMGYKKMAESISNQF